MSDSVIKLNLSIDEEKKKVVFAEAGKDFVDILFSLLALPMGAIVRLMEMYQKSGSIPIGCFRNIYASVANIGIEHFRTEACKQMLLYPKSLSHEKFQNFKLRIVDYEVNCFVCPMFDTNRQCSKLYTNFYGRTCSCGKLMSSEIKFDNDEVLGCGYPSFIITDDLKVQIITPGLTLNVLKDLGYTNGEKLVGRIQNVQLQELVTLLKSSFTSNTPLTNTFLKKSSSYGMMSVFKTLNSPLCEEKTESNDDQVIKVNAYVNKKEGSIIYVECGEDFVDLLFTFLAIPLEEIVTTLGKRINFGCIENLSRSFKDLSINFEREAKCALPYYYKIQKQLLDVVTSIKPPTYYRYMVSNSSLRDYEYRVSVNSGKKPVCLSDKVVPMICIDPISEGHSNTLDKSSTSSDGFLKRGKKLMVLDDLSITLSNFCSTLGLLKDKKIEFDDVEVKVISISKEKALMLLQASLVASTALNTALLVKESALTSKGNNRVSKKPKIEP